MLYSYKEKNKGLQPIYLVGGLSNNDSGQLEQRFRLIPEAEIEGVCVFVGSPPSPTNRPRARAPVPAPTNTHTRSHSGRCRFTIRALLFCFC